MQKLKVFANFLIMLKIVESTRLILDNLWNSLVSRRKSSEILNCITI